MFSWTPKLVMLKVGHVTVSSAAVWFTVTAITFQIFLSPYPTCHRLIFVPKLATSLTSILLATFSVTATVFAEGEVWQTTARTNRAYGTNQIGPRIEETI